MLAPRFPHYWVCWLVEITGRIFFPTSAGPLMSSTLFLFYFCHWKTLWTILEYIHDSFQYQYAIQTQNANSSV